MGFLYGDFKWGFCTGFELGNLNWDFKYSQLKGFYEGLRMGILNGDYKCGF